ncbi:hypothetical protein [Lutibacter sp.]|uniref:hypothetical protein n=1 Tax=Lutibacter sp. TaxID=1925666 RepID=UPI001A35E3CD|nr:hypothetical protein [Lutibacter sp.]MBI9042576.1 hypothetical protein [Lutibacter sp.]
MLQKLISKNIFIIAISLFVLSAFLGLLIRWNFVFPSQLISYKNFVQGHSHVAFLGWGYLAVIGAILKFFISNENRSKPIYKTTLLIIILSVFLMLFSFPISGYKVLSIVLLTVFGITSYVLSFNLLSDLNGGNTSNKLLRFGIYYYLLSSLATWFLVFVIIKIGKSDLYYNTIYFYLHFLYNGFFVFALFGLLFKVFENQQILISEKYKKLFFIYLNVACIPAYFLSILWSSNSSVFYIFGFAAAFLQLISLLFLFKILQQVFLTLKWNVLSKVLLKFLIIAYSLKVLSQFLSAFPYVVQKSLALKPFFIIGYLHLFTLAFMSVFIILILSMIGKIFMENTISKIGISTFLCGIILTEFLLFGEGFLILIKLKPISNYNLWLLACSGILFLGIFLVFITQLLKPKIVI